MVRHVPKSPSPEDESPLELEVFGQMMRKALTNEKVEPRELQDWVNTLERVRLRRLFGPRPQPFPEDDADDAKRQDVRRSRAAAPVRDGKPRELTEWFETVSEYRVPVEIKKRRDDPLERLEEQRRREAELGERLDRLKARQLVVPRLAELPELLKSIWIKRWGVPELIDEVVIYPLPWKPIPKPMPIPPNKLPRFERPSSEERWVPA